MDFGAISSDFEVRTQNFAAAKKIRKFRTEMRSEPHAISRSTACQRSAQLSGTSKGREQAAHHQAAWISARSHAISDAKFEFSKISVRNRLEIARNITRRSMLTLATDVGDLKRSSGSCASPGGMDFGAFSRDFERKILRPRKFRFEIGPKSHKISRAAAY